MMRQVIFLLLAASIGFVLPGSSEIVKAQQMRIVRIAMIAPRGTVVHREFEKVDVAIRKDTNNAWGLRLYPSGMAGDDTDVIRKMRINQLDSAIVTATGLAQIVRPVAILDAPGVIRTYEELEAVQKEMNQEWEGIFLEKGVKLLSWWETGQYRIFSKGPINSVADFRRHRPWIWPISFVLKELWSTLGVVGVPLDIPDVFGALQTGMIDMLIASPVVLVAMRWHVKLNTMTEQNAGVLLTSWIINKSIWEQMPEIVRKKIAEGVAQWAPRARNMARTEDAGAYQKLLKTGYSLTKQTPQQIKEWRDIERTVQKKLAGRLYPETLLRRIETITAKLRSGA
jgi:TRAP-type C4-dicarboxylate transport system substrate-binding protein